MNEKLQPEHKPITLILEIDEKERRFVTPKKINGTLWREAAMVSEEIESSEVLIADLDSHLQFVCNVFGNQFTIDEFEEGIDARDLVKTVYAVSLFVLGQVAVAAEMLVSSVDVEEIDEKKR